MGTRLENKNGKNLYEFWGDRLSEIISTTLIHIKIRLLLIVLQTSILNQSTTRHLVRKSSRLNSKKLKMVKLE